ncbi:FGGY-family carbohydrate kinase [Streptomyces clavuligerus]|nr:FGGY-family carbohydrate kinase [Streptomyces clavuligerus]ANW20203.1 carbohydrate kinase [Streptomyces clavuligerus]MBY6304863.1 carbohydrate kinase [Streptomyces clavuligerus]QPL64835.1 carbohydrate kinase [Streptomyces clavuligerus]QPL70866.1 carbohydrate kinase [Streptomyces clavuligerus]QPL76948.1 carbohydrate kinase [Streptomyces clavuligerus]
MWLGIDLGTQSVRALLADDDGTVRGGGSAPLTGRREGPLHEQSPADWWTAVKAAVRGALAGGGRPRALAICSTSGTVLLGDDRGRPLTPAVMYDDGRAPGRGPGRALLLQREYGPGRVLHQADLIAARLLGRLPPTDSSHALKTGWDPERGAFTGPDVPGLPEVVPPGTPLGAVDRAAADETGIPAGTVVVAGMTDGCAAQIASGALTVGSWNSVLGTTLVLKGVTATPLRDPAGVVYSHLSPDGHWLPGGASNVGGGALTAAFPGADPAALDALAAACEPAGAVAYPLTGQGERFPFAAPGASGFLLGTPASDADHWAALLQGVAFVERLCYDRLDLIGAPVDGPVTVTGGAARSGYWNRLRAEVLGRPVRVPEVSESALGMAVLAALGAGAAPTLAAAAGRMTRLRETVRPEHRGRFTEPYLALVDALERRAWLPSDLAAHARTRADTPR